MAPRAWGPADGRHWCWQCALPVPGTSKPGPVPPLQLYVTNGARAAALWLERAVTVLSPPDAPWARLKHGAKVAFAAELGEGGMPAEPARFKRLVSHAV